MNSRVKIGAWFSYYNEYFKVRSITLTLLFILTGFNSCLELEKGGTPSKIEGYVIDKISNEKLDSAKIQIQELFHRNWINGELEPRTIETGYTDATGHFQIEYNLKSEYSYALGISRDFYFYENDYRFSPTSVNNLRIELFPHGYVKTHVTNKIDSARWMDIYFTPIYNSMEIYRFGFINCNYFSRATLDTSFITTTVGGVMNQMKILINSTDYIPDAIEVKDTSFFTLTHDTVFLNIILY